MWYIPQCDKSLFCKAYLISPFWCFTVSVFQSVTGRFTLFQYVSACFTVSHWSLIQFILPNRLVLRVRRGSRQRRDNLRPRGRAFRRVLPIKARSRRGRAGRATSHDGERPR